MGIVFNIKWWAVVGLIHGTHSVFFWTQNAWNTCNTPKIRMPRKLKKLAPLLKTRTRCTLAAHKLHIYRYPIYFCFFFLSETKKDKSCSLNIDQVIVNCCLTHTRSHTRSAHTHAFTWLHKNVVNRTPIIMQHLMSKHSWPLIVTIHSIQKNIHIIRIITTMVDG